jgi:hypothetical protein
MRAAKRWAEEAANLRRPVTMRAAKRWAEEAANLAPPVTMRAAKRWAEEAANLAPPKSCLSRSYCPRWCDLPLTMSRYLPSSRSR